MRQYECVCLQCGQTRQFAFPEPYPSLGEKFSRHCTACTSDTIHTRPLTEEVMIPVENIHGRLLLIGCEDDCLWPTARYIRRMKIRLESHENHCKYDALVYPYGTHYAFPESMLKQILPIFPDFFIGRAFRSAKEHPKECKATREDIDLRMKTAIHDWIGKTPQ